MIKSKNDLKLYLECDKNAMGIKRKSSTLFGCEVWKYLICLRKLEYYTNAQKNVINIIMKCYYKYKYHKFETKLHFYIKPNCFDEGLSIAHIGPIIINDYAKIGKNCRVHVGGKYWCKDL